MFRKILVPLDGSRLAEKALPFVEEMARKFDAEVVLGWVIQLRPPAIPEYEAAAYGLTPLLDTSGERERARAYLQGIQQRLLQRQIRSSIKIVESHAIADAIVAIAYDTGVDLIAKTTYARLGPSRWLHGNVAAQVLKRSSCPLFLVRVSEDEADRLAGEDAAYSAPVRSE
ncbi:MAG: universal stress protein [Caldilineaceae bacterium]|nr:universal stress protein [Caldilineaceae bacterium]